MPRYFENEAEMHQGIKGWRGRSAYFTAKVEAHRAAVNSPEALAAARLRNLVNEEFRLGRAIGAAEDHVALLRGKLAKARAEVESIGAKAFQTGDIDPNVIRIRVQIQGLPDLITRAERELRDARNALAAHHDRMAAEMAAARAEVEPVEAEPVHDAGPAEVQPAEARRGPGRPRKVAA